MSKITYQTQETPFYKALQTEVEAYFATKNKEKIGNASLYIKGIIIFSLAVYLYVQLVFFTPMWWVAIPLAAIFGVSLHPRIHAIPCTNINTYMHPFCTRLL